MGWGEKFPDNVYGTMPKYKESNVFDHAWLFGTVPLKLGAIT